MRRLLLVVLVLGMALVAGAATASANTPSGSAGFTLLGGVSLLNPASEQAGAGAAPDSNADVTCTGIAPAIVPRDLIVPSGATCLALDGTTIGRDVIVESGADLGTGGITVGRDVIGHDPDAIEIGDFKRGSGRSFIGRDVDVTGATSSLLLQEVCNTTIGHDLIWQNDADTAGLSVGDQDFFCFTGTDYVGHDAIIQSNQGLSEIADNNPANGGGGIGHDLVVQNNTNTVVESNAVGHDCEQQNNQPYSNDDGDSTGPNTAGHSIGTCNTPNP